MAKKSSRRKKSFTIPLATVAGTAGAIAPLIPYIQVGDFNNLGKIAVRNFTGIDPYNNNQFNPALLMNGLIPLLAGVFVSMLASKLGINRRMARSIPFLRI